MRHKRQIGKVSRRYRNIIKESRNGRSGHVYIMELNKGIYKIGRTIDIAARQKELQASNPNLRTIHNMYVIDMYATEKELHRIFRNRRVSREAFALDRNELEKAKRIINEATASCS